MKEKARHLNLLQFFSLLLHSYYKNLSTYIYCLLKATKIANGLFNLTKTKTYLNGKA